MSQRNSAGPSKAKIAQVIFPDGVVKAVSSALSLTLRSLGTGNSLLSAPGTTEGVSLVWGLAVTVTVGLGLAPPKLMVQALTRTNKVATATHKPSKRGADIFFISLIAKADAGADPIGGSNPPGYYSQPGALVPEPAPKLRP